MRTLEESAPLRYVVFGALYFAQGVPWGFVSVGYVVFLTDLGLDNTAVGAAIGVAYLPWSFKLVWGPLFDRFPSLRFGRRRPYILAAEAGMGLSLLGLLLVDPTRDLFAVSVILFVHNTFASMQDVASDALAVDVLPAPQRGKANAIMWAAKSAGVAVGGGAGTVFAKHLGWPALFTTIACLLVAIMALVLVIRERPFDPRARGVDPQRLRWAEIKRSFAFSTPLLGLVSAAATVAGAGLVIAVFTRTIRADLHFSEEDIATLNGVIDPVSGVAGALLGGVLADKIGTRKAMGAFLLATGVGFGVFAAALPSGPSFAFVGAWLGAYTFLYSGFSAASLSFYMALSNPAIAATQFTAFMAMSNLTYAWASPLGGAIADGLGAPAAFVAAAVVCVASIALLPLIDPRRAEARFRRPDPVPALG